MIKKILLVAFGLLLLSTGSMQAQSESAPQAQVYSSDDGIVASNLDFSVGAPVDNGICTYGRDMEGQGTTYYGMLDVEGWTIVESGENTDDGYDNNALAGGIFAYGSEQWLGGKGYCVPATNPEGKTGGNALGFLACWGGEGRYIQSVTLAPGSYTITVCVYNAVGGTYVPGKSYIGFIADDGTEYLASAKAYPVDTWTTEVVKFTLDDETSGVLSLGYKSYVTGSAGNPHLFFDCMKIKEGFAPDPPAEPAVPVFKYPLTVTCEPKEAGSASGNGNYYAGSSATVSTSANVDYTFSHWTLNGERYEVDATQFVYTTVEGQMDFVAVYEYTPAPFEPNAPADPTMEVKSRLYLTSNPEGVCTFNRTSGAYVESEEYVSVSVTNFDLGYEFVGWYEDGVLLTTSQTFNYLPDVEDATLEARFEKLPEEDFNPDAPAEPEMSEDQENVQTGLEGDANEDGLVDVLDVVIAINIYLSGSSDGYNFNLCDVNNDGQVDVLDVVSIINIYLGK